MLRAFKELFEQVAPGEANSVGEDGVQLAAAALMMEISRADQQIDDAEHKTIHAAIQRAFGFDASRADALIEQARAKSEDATSLYEFTRIINDHFDDEAKYELMLNLWRVAYADGNVDRYESHLLWRVADLIHMRQRDYIRAKLAVAPP